MREVCATLAMRHALGGRVRRATELGVITALIVGFSLAGNSHARGAAPH
jgi:hypothetical protein